MSEDNDQERKEQEWWLRWWVRYLFVPIAVASIAGYSAVQAARIVYSKDTPMVTTSPGLPSSQEVIPTESPLPLISPSTLPATPTDTATLTPTATSTAPATPIQGIDVIGEHMVRSGEHLFCIGRAYGVRPEAIAQASNLDQPSFLSPGQVLVIPAVQWRGIPNGPVCAAQFDSPFADAATFDPAPVPTGEPVTAQADEQAPTDTPTPTITPTDTPTPTPTPTDTPTAILYEEPYPAATEPPAQGIETPTNTAVAATEAPTSTMQPAATP